MKKLGEKIVKLRIPILILATILLIPALIGYKATRVNYDMLVYLPQDIDTMKGQDILKAEFGTGAFAPLEVDGMTDKQVADLKAKIEDVPHVKDVIWYDTVLNLSVPKEILPQDIYDAFNKGDATLMFIIFDDGTSEDGTVEAVKQIRKICSTQCFLGGMTPGLVDTQELSDREAPIYIGIAVLLTIIVLSLAMDSYLVPFIFLLSIGYAVLYNMGTNLFLGKISYITKSIAAVLQLGVTMDYSIFLWHSYEHYLTTEKDKETAMAKAVNDTFSSIIGSSVTTIAGFIALCFMSFTLGLDMGLVMAKGVLFGVVSCITVLPSMVLTFDKPLQKTRHKKTIMPEFHGIGKFVTKHFKVFFALFWIILIPALYGYSHTNVYYQLDKSLPKDLQSVIAADRIENTFNMTTTDVLMVNSVPAKDIQTMAKQMEDVDGVRFVLGFNTVKGPSIPDEFISKDLKSDLINDHWQLLLIQSEYHVASDEVNAQCNALTAIAKQYDPNSMLIGEAPATKDLITITHPAGVPLDLASRHSGGGHRVRYLHQPRHSLLYGNGPSVRCLYHHRHDPAGLHGGLRHPDDDEVPAGEDKGDCEERGGAHRPAGERQVDCRLRPDLLLRDLWRRSLFRHRHREFHVRPDGARRADLHDLRSAHASRIPDGV